MSSASTYEQLEGRFEYAAGIFEVNLRLDQSAGVWLTAAGTVPLALFSEGELDLPINISVASSPDQPRAHRGTDRSRERM